ncbi:unnamed protein product, partial [Ectocarpus sp. 8 AP-2014]
MVHVYKSASAGVAAVLTACRSVPRMHLRVELGTPRHMWVAATRLRTRNEMQPITTRVPAFRPRKVTWNIPAATLDAASDPLASVECIKFGCRFNGSFDSILWPRNVKHIKFDADFNMPVDMVQWPASLQQLMFGQDFDWPIDRIAWPSSLQRISLGMSFNWRIDRVTWPSSVQQI